MIHFDLPKEKSSIIKVIGVGGGGSNAVNHMFNQGIDGVNFIICNTDAQALALSKVPNKIQLGPHLTQGLGAGANPEIGKQATEESLEEIKRILEVNTKMAFITAGMGGGTGTGGAPIIAQICRELGILTVGIITTPFSHEGKKRLIQAEEGIKSLKGYVDTLLVVSNDKLRHQFGNLKIKEAFAKADNVLATAAKCITDVISSTGQINVDFADVCTVMRNGGVAILGNAEVSGESRAQRAIEQALNSPLLNDNDIRGAKWILININSAEGEHEFTMDEVEIIQNYLIAQAGDNTDVILGLGYDHTLEDKIGITLIATGFHHKDPFNKKEKPKKEIKEEKIVLTLGNPVEEEKKIFHHQATLFAPESVVKEIEKEAPLVNKGEEKVVEEKNNDLMPTLVEVEEQKPVVTIMPSLLFDTEAINESKERELTNEENTDKKDPSVDFVLTTSPAYSAGYLAKPVHIYAAENKENKTSETEKEKEKDETETVSTPIVQIKTEDESLFDMQLIEKEQEEENHREPIQMEHIEKDETLDESQLNEEEAMRRKAAERLHKLRNLTFNINQLTDANNEYENIPAYQRRNMELHNTIASVESFYSNYTVKTDENNKTEISTINTFLDGKKPD